MSHEILLRKLSACSIGGDLHIYVHNYLQNQKHITTLNGATSNLAFVEYGVPQESLIGPPCFYIMSTICHTRYEILISCMFVCIFIHTTYSFQKIKKKKNKECFQWTNFFYKILSVVNSDYSLHLWCMWRNKSQYQFIISYNHIEKDRLFRVVAIW